MSTVHLWGGLESAEGELPLYFGYAVEEHGFAWQEDVQRAAEREVNKARLAMNLDPWQRWSLSGIWRGEFDGRKELRANIWSARRGVVGELELIWPNAQDLEGAS